MRRTISKSRKRFFSIMLITALGVTMLTGLKAACVDLRASADSFYDAQRLFDVAVVSTLGLTEQDVRALAALEGVEAAEGSYSETVTTQVRDQQRSAEVKMLSDAGINAPYLLEGTLPQSAGEIAVTQNYINETGKAPGDTLTIAEDVQRRAEEETDEAWAQDLQQQETPNFTRTSFTISGVVVDPMDVNRAEGAVAFRASSNADYIFFVTPQAVKSDVYSAVYLTLDTTRGLLCYSGAYDARVAGVIDAIEGQIKQQRERARYVAVVGDATAKVDDAQRQMDGEFAQADTQLADAQAKLDDGQRQVEEGGRALAQNERMAGAQFQQAWRTINDGYASVAQGERALAQQEAQLAQGAAQLAQGKEELAQQEAQAKGALQDARAQLEQQQTQCAQQHGALMAQCDDLSAPFGPLWPAQAWESWTAAAKQAALPIAQGDAQARALQQQMAQLAPDTAAYADAARQLAQVQADVQQATQALPEALAPHQQAFFDALAPVLQGARAQLDAAIAALDLQAPQDAARREALLAQRGALDTLEETLPKLALGLGQLEAAQDVVQGQLEALAQQQAKTEATFKAAWEQIASQEAALKEGRRQLEQGCGTLKESRAQLDAGARTLQGEQAAARRQIADGKRTLQDSQRELEEGQSALDEEKRTFEETRADAQQKLQDARKEIADIDMTQWYVQDRTSLSGYVNVQSDAASIEAVGTAFPVVFFVVAILISLTTITRMVEEERALIGTYKALGFTDREILAKYLLYAFAACLIGGVLGDICGFILLPKFVFTIFRTLYQLPAYQLAFQLGRGVGAILLFMLGIVGATVLACRAELKQMPAVLMRPRAPRAGSRVFLERIPLLWNRLSFLNKVTARNLFRYKKRLFMTVAGIMGCTALLLCGFAIKNSVADLMPRQYEQTYQYDLMVGCAPEDNDQMCALLQNDANVADFINVQLEMVKLKNAQGDSESVQLVVVPEGVSLARYIHLKDAHGAQVALADDGIYVTQNAAQVLGFGTGEGVFVQNALLEQRQMPVAGIVRNYLGNAVYMTQRVYENAFTSFAPNGVYAHLSDACANQAAYADALGREDIIRSSVSTQALKRDFYSAFSLINAVVYIIIVMAAGLAFVVLFTLSTTNISERVRELATIKVLGFFDRETHRYVNKETLILTLLGIALGLPAGWGLSSCLTYVLKMPSIYFAVSIHPQSYFLAAALSLAFALAVNLLTNRTLNRIDMVEALKSVE